MDVINDNTNSKSNDMFTRTIYTFTKLKQEREKERGEEREEKGCKLSLEAPCKPPTSPLDPQQLFSRPASPSRRPSKSWRFGQRHLQAGKLS